MLATKITRSESRITETPNALMTTLASPTQGGTKTLSLWRVTMRAGQCGPQHTFDVEQVWHVLDGTANVIAGAERIDLAVGDTLVIPAGTQRQVSTESGAVFVVTGPADGGARPVSAEGPGDSVAPPWIV